MALKVFGLCSSVAVTVTFHHVSARHLNRYVTEFSGRYNVREEDTIDPMQDVVTNMVGKRLMYKGFDRFYLAACLF